MNKLLKLQIFVFSKRVSKRGQHFVLNNYIYCLIHHRWFQEALTLIFCGWRVPTAMHRIVGSFWHHVTKPATQTHIAFHMDQAAIILKWKSGVSKQITDKLHIKNCSLLESTILSYSILHKIFLKFPSSNSGWNNGKFRSSDIAFTLAMSRKWFYNNCYAGIT